MLCPSKRERPRLPELDAQFRECNAPDNERMHFLSPFHVLYVIYTNRVALLTITRAARENFYEIAESDYPIKRIFTDEMTREILYIAASDMQHWIY